MQSVAAWKIHMLLFLFMHYYNAIDSSLMLIQALLRPRYLYPVPMNIMIKSLYNQSSLNILIAVCLSKCPNNLVVILSILISSHKNAVMLC